MKSICVLCSLYPNEIHPAKQVFVQQLVWALADMDIDCTVICPLPINQYPELKKLSTHVIELSPTGKKIEVYFPKVFSAGQRNIFGFKTARLTTYLFLRAVKKIVSTLPSKPDVLYGHFFTPAGIVAAKIGLMHKIPSFVAYGESSPWSIFNYGLERIKKESKNLAGVISVSTANKNDLIDLDVMANDKIGVFPNGIRTDHFFPRDRAESRKKFGFDADCFIIAFSGHFSDRKGVLRLRDAVDQIEGVRVIYAGKGTLDPHSEKTMFKGIVKPEDMPSFLCTADIFVLPTLNEGCSNAIVEAVACGLPVISTDSPFNYDILDETNSLLIDSSDINAIKEAIVSLKENKQLYNKLKDGAIKRSGQLSLEKRAKNIKLWIESQLNEG